MTTNEAHDKFLKLLSQKDPILFNKFKDTQFITADGVGRESGITEIKFFFETQLFNESEQEEIRNLFTEVLEISN